MAPRTLESVLRAITQDEIPAKISAPVFFWVIGLTKQDEGGLVPLVVAEWARGGKKIDEKSLPTATWGGGG